MARVDLNDRDSRVDCLVAKEAGELVERPAREPIASVSAPSPDPVANPLEVLKSDTTSGAFGGLDDRLADTVVLVAPEPGFLARQALQFLLGSFGALALQSLPLEVVFAVHVLDGFTAMALRIVARGGNLGDAQVDAEEVGRLDRFRRFAWKLDVQEVLPIPLYQLGGRGLDRFENASLSLAGWVSIRCREWSRVRLAVQSHGRNEKIRAS